jgi:hypothetical protein
MSHFPKTLLLFLAFTAAIPLAGCMEETVPVSLSVHDHYPDSQVLGASVNGEASAPVGGMICCVTIPKKWKPGLTAKVSWSVYLDDPDTQESPSSSRQLFRKSAVVEIPEYDKAARVQVHIYPGDKARLVVAQQDIGSPFYPLPRAEWPPYEVDNILIHRIVHIPGYFSWGTPYPASKRDWEWAKQWGVTQDGKCTDPDYLAWEKKFDAGIQEGEKKQQEEEQKLQPSQELNPLQEQSK